MKKVEKIQELLLLNESSGIVTSRGLYSRYGHYVAVKSISGSTDISVLYCKSEEDAIKLESEIIKYCTGVEKSSDIDLLAKMRKLERK